MSSRIAGLILPILAALPGAARADRSGYAGIDTQVTHYGTQFRTLWITTIEATLEMPVSGDLTMLLRLPLAVSHRGADGCCFISTGNLTPGLRHGLARGPFRGAVEASISLPTSMGPGDAMRFNHAYAATAELHGDAGLYQGGTTVRLGGFGRVAVTERWSILGAAAIHGWHLEDGHDQVILPLAIGGAYAAGAELEMAASLLTLIKPDEDGEQLLHAVQLDLAHRGRPWSIGGRITVPLDASMRRLGMVGGGMMIGRRL